jgi:hypothetical protein
MAKKGWRELEELLWACLLVPDVGLRHGKAGHMVDGMMESWRLVRKILPECPSHTGF